MKVVMVSLLCGGPRDRREEQARPPGSIGSLVTPARARHASVGCWPCSSRRSSIRVLSSGRQLEETLPHLGDPATSGRPSESLAPASPDREAFFAGRVQLAEAALRRIRAPSRVAGRARARAVTPGPDGWIHRLGDRVTDHGKVHPRPARTCNSRPAAQQLPWHRQACPTITSPAHDAAG